MTKQEFTKRTGFYPTEGLYRVIEEAYIGYDGDKDTFCKAYLANANGIAESIACKAEKRSKELLDGLGETIAIYRKHVDKLQTALDAELEWQPYKGAGTRMTQREYQKLSEDSSARTMSDKEAANFIAEELGFNAARVKIIHSVEVFEVNRHHRLRVAENYDREPYYKSTDWNYVRFDVNGIEYEYINGQLTLYCR